MIKPATAWYRFEKGQWKYNHFEYGINQRDEGPEPESEDQQVWNDLIWARKYGYYQNALGRTKLVMESPLML
ncbi:MAG TPA: hypothetical protein VLA13_01120 [Massilibacterium sp.]|nr:hypothetical protein [Massilibacterium sp.]